METSTSTPTGVTIYRTRQYDLFTLIPSNRPIYSNALNRLVHAIKIRNKLAQNPIRVTPDGEVLDGQHRLRAAEMLELEIYYYIDNSDTEIMDIALENYAVRRWTHEDVLNYWCEHGMEPYLAMRDFIKHHPWVTISVAIAIMHGKQSNSYIKGQKREDFILGKYEITDMSFACRFANAIGDFMNVIDFATHKPFMASISYLLKLPAYDHERMMIQVDRAGHLLARRVNKTEYLRDLEKIYNHYAKEGNRARFF